MFVRQLSRWLFLLLVSLMCLQAARCSSAQSQQDLEPVAENAYIATAVPLLQTYCSDCHSGDGAEGGLDFDKYESSSLIQTDFAEWEKILRVISERQMPPQDADQPDEDELAQLREILAAELASFDCTTGARPGRVTIRRLNRQEYNNTIRDLVGIDFHPANEFPSDDVGNGFDNIGDVLVIPPLLMEKYLAAAEEIADRVFADEAARRRILVAEVEGEGEDRLEAVKQNIRGFATRAFRRPVSDEEVDRLTRLMVGAYLEGSPPDEAFKLGIQAVLASPHFLFRVEGEPTSANKSEPYELNDYEIASRLSYFLWSSMPDEELFSLARAGTLKQPQVLREQARRMLRDPKAVALTENFAGQWLQLRDIDLLSPDPVTFPNYDADLRDSIRRETELFFESVVQEDRSILEFLTADFSFVNERLAKHYNIPDVEGEEFRRVSLPPQRRGVLTQASVLLITSNPTRTSPVKRGKWILDNILGEPPPPPPEGVEELPEAEEALGSLRERMEEHRANESCAVCHRKMDTLGFGLENFDVTGAWRTQDGRFSIDAAGSLPGDLKFETPGQLMNILAEEKSQEFSRCMTEKMLIYALGRGLESFDRCAVDRIVGNLVENDYRFGQMVEAIVTSEPFLKREGKGDH